MLVSSSSSSSCWTPDAAAAADASACFATSSRTAECRREQRTMNSVGEMSDSVTVTLSPSRAGAPRLAVVKPAGSVRLRGCHSEEAAAAAEAEAEVALDAF